MDMSGLAAIFSERQFWDKVLHGAKRIGAEILEKGLMLFYTARSPETPKWAKTAIYGALAYFVLPADAIPDFIPAAGFTDDLGALAATLAAVMMYITPEIKAKARDQAHQLFGQD